jgi:hypothetical protein
MKQGDLALWLIAGAVAYYVYRQTQSQTQPQVVYLNGFPGYAYGHDQPDIINVTVPPTPVPPPPTPPPPGP